MSFQHKMTLTERAAILRARAAAAKDAPILSRMAEAVAIADQVAALLVDLARAVDHLTPFTDETSASHEGGEVTFCSSRAGAEAVEPDAAEGEAET